MQLTITSPLLSVLILPNCGPDMKYFLAFARTQLSTSITMILVFGPKVRLKIDLNSCLASGVSK